MNVDDSGTSPGLGNSNRAFAFGDGSFAQAVLGNNNIASVFGNQSSAGVHIGDNNIASVFGKQQHRHRERRQSNGHRRGDNMTKP
jgi:hypothetical protein